jgi:hypothetical protein
VSLSACPQHAWRIDFLATMSLESLSPFFCCQSLRSCSVECNHVCIGRGHCHVGRRLCLHHHADDGHHGCIPVGWARGSARQARGAPCGGPWPSSQWFPTPLAYEPRGYHWCPTSGLRGRVGPWADIPSTWGAAHWPPLAAWDGDCHPSCVPSKHTGEIVDGLLARTCDGAVLFGLV